MAALARNGFWVECPFSTHCRHSGTGYALDHRGGIRESLVVTPFSAGSVVTLESTGASCFSPPDRGDGAAVQFIDWGASSCRLGSA